MIEKPKPLRMQMITTSSVYVGADRVKPVMITTESQLRLAVEWLKKELILPHATDEINKWFQDKIDEAFPDLKTSPNNNFKAHFDSPKFSPEGFCYQCQEADGNYLCERQYCECKCHQGKTS